MTSSRSLRAGRTRANAILIASALTAASIGVMWLSRDSREVNPAVFVAFRAIAAGCQQQVGLDPTERTVACDAVNETGHVGDATAEEHYRFLSRLGFNLPPLYLQAPN